MFVFDTGTSNTPEWSIYWLHAVVKFTRSGNNAGQICNSSLSRMIADISGLCRHLEDGNLPKSKKQTKPWRINLVRAFYYKTLLLMYGERSPIFKNLKNCYQQEGQTNCCTTSSPFIEPCARPHKFTQFVFLSHTESMMPCSNYLCITPSHIDLTVVHISTIPITPIIVALIVADILIPAATKLVVLDDSGGCIWIWH